MDKLRELYARYPMTVVRVAGFVLGVPAVCVIMLAIHEMLGINLYRRLYAPVLTALGSVHFFFLRKAATRHVQTHHPGWNIQNSHLYEKYAVFLTAVAVLLAVAAVYGLFEALQ